MKTRDFSHISLLAIFLAATYLLLSLFTMGTANAQSAGSCSKGLFHIADDGLYSLNTANMSYTLASSTPDIDAAGFDVNTGLIFGLNSSEELVSIDPDTGESNNLGQTVSATDPGVALSDEFINTGRYDRFKLGDVSGGKLFAIPGGESSQPINDGSDAVLSYMERDALKDVFEIDLTTNTYVKRLIEYPGNDISPDVNDIYLDGDIVFANGKLYTANGNTGFSNGRLVTIDLATNEAAEATLSGLPRNSQYGSQWIAKDQQTGLSRMFVARNENGYVFEVKNFDGALASNPTSNLVGISASTNGQSDGASCPESAVPQFNIRAEDDFVQTAVGQGIDIDWRSNDESVSDSAISSVDFQSQNGGQITLVDGTLRYVPAEGFAGEDSFSYTVCLKDYSVTGCGVATVNVLVASPLLSLSSSIITQQFKPGQQVDVEYYFQNVGNSDAQDVTLSVNLPVGSSHVDNGQWSCQSDLCTFNFGSLDPNANEALTLSLLTDQDASSFALDAALNSSNASAKTTRSVFNPEVTVVQGAEIVDTDDTDSPSPDDDEEVVVAANVDDGAADDASSDESPSTTVVLAETGISIGLSIVAGAVLMLAAYKTTWGNKLRTKHFSLKS